MRKRAAQTPLFHAIEKWFALINHMDCVKLYRLVPDSFPASMHYPSEIEDRCTCRQHLRFLPRKLNHAALKDATCFYSVMKMQRNRGTRLNIQYAADYLHSGRTAQIGLVQYRSLHSLLSVRWKSSKRSDKTRYDNYEPHNGMHCFLLRLRCPKDQFI